MAILGSRCLTAYGEGQKGIFLELMLLLFSTSCPHLNSMRHLNHVNCKPAPNMAEAAITILWVDLWIPSEAVVSDWWGEQLRRGPIMTTSPRRDGLQVKYLPVHPTSVFLWRVFNGSKHKDCCSRSMIMIWVQSAVVYNALC